MKSMPISISSEKVRLLKLIEDNKKEHEIIAKKLQDEETKANETNKELKLEEVKLNEFREEKIRVEGIIGTHNESIRQLTEQVKERLNVALEDLYDLAKINPNKILAPLEDLERKLERLIAEQERLGGVNLLAEQEAKELEDKVDSIKKNQSDLIAAIYTPGSNFDVSYRNSLKS